MTDPITSIGKLLAGGEERDCIHIAIFPAVADEGLHRGEPVVLGPGTNLVTSAWRNEANPAMGIVDPFLKQEWVSRGESVWVFLFPGTVTGMRHHWTLPAIDGQSADEGRTLSNARQVKAEKWLRAFADKWGMDYDRMLAEASGPLGGAVTSGITLSGRDELDPIDEELFWEHIETLTGRTFSNEHRKELGWRCSC